MLNQLRLFISFPGIIKADIAGKSRVEILPHFKKCSFISWYTYTFDFKVNERL